MTHVRSQICCHAHSWQAVSATLVWTRQIFDSVWISWLCGACSIRRFNLCQCFCFAVAVRARPQTLAVSSQRSLFVSVRTLMCLASFKMRSWHLEPSSLQSQPLLGFTGILGLWLFGCVVPAVSSVARDPSIFNCPLLFWSSFWGAPGLHIQSCTECFTTSCDLFVVEILPALTAQWRDLVQVHGGFMVLLYWGWAAPCVH